MKYNPMLLADFYKIAHREQYPENTEYVYSTWTPRSGKHLPRAKGAVCFGIQSFVKEYLIDYFDENFFSVPKDDLVNEYKRFISATLLVQNPHTKHIEDLHDLGYLPLEVKALDEGTMVPFRVPMMTVENTDPRFFWLTNYIETLASSSLWKQSTTATISKVYRDILDKFAKETTGSVEGVEFQGHDFSMRGMGGLHDAAQGGSGHLLNFVGTDTMPSIQYLEKYYNADITKELVGCSVPASEHSVMSAGSKDGEFETYRRLIEDIHPTGIVSIVSDTWDLWHVLTDTIPKLKDKILARNGGEGSIDKVVIRPDSGDPVDILCGTYLVDSVLPKSKPEHKGVIELLWDTFGGTVNEQGYKVLDSHIGAIYGDSITPERCEAICQRLKDKGFASTNVVFGIGSYTYQMITRDSLGFAMKATSVTIGGKEQAIFKDPVTDDGTKKSAKGRVKVHKYERGDKKGQLYYQDDETKMLDESKDLLTTVFKDGKLVKETSLADVRGRLRNANS